MGGSTKLRTKLVGEKKAKIAIGSTVFFFKNEDNASKGVVFGKVISKVKSNYKIETSKGIMVLIPYERIRIFVPEQPYPELLEQTDSSELVDNEKRLAEAMESVGIDPLEK